MEPDYFALLERRLERRPTGPLDVWSKLRHFALINYALPKARLTPYVPAEQFEIPEFNLGGQRLALMSAVPFVDVDFHFLQLFPFLKFGFGQTNYRVYVIHKATGEHGVWFFGTTLGSPVVHLARGAWGIPWHPAHYQTNFHYDASLRRYTTYRCAIQSRWADAQIELDDSGDPVAAVEGFDSLAAFQLILTHPVEGYYYRADGRVGGYSVWHERIPLTVGRARHLYFGLYERLGLLSRAEMQRPHSIYLCPETEFQVFLPPKIITPAG